jgi:small conductance mechanosensitive channel
MVEPLPFLDFLGEYALIVTQVIYFVVAFVGVYVLGRVIISPFVRRVLSRSDLDAHARRPIRRIINVLIVFVAIAAAFGAAGLANFLTSFATIAAAGTLAIGLAMQDVISNFVAGVFIYTDRPFRIDDWIEWDGNRGIVEDISLRVTRVRTFDNELLTVPNGLLTDGVIKNPVAKDQLRIQFEFGIGYDDDIQTATDLIIDEANRQDDILDEPAPSVVLSQLADSYVGLTARIWIANPSRAEFLRIRSGYVTGVKNRFDQQGIEIPFPQRDLSGGIELADSTVLATESSD